jgi:hypothetical protein
VKPGALGGQSRKENKMECKNCKFFHEINVWGRCQKYAPRPNVSTDNHMWPVISADDWCGEFLSKSAQQGAAPDAERGTVSNLENKAN